MSPKAARLAGTGAYVYSAPSRHIVPRAHSHLTSSAAVAAFAFACGIPRAIVSVNIFFTIFTNVFSPIAPTRMRRIRQRGCAAFGV